MYGKRPYSYFGANMTTVLTGLRRKGTDKARERIDVRLHPEQKSDIERAAQIKGLTLTDFIVQYAVENARQTIREYETWTLDRPDAELFSAALMKPAKLGPQLTRAAKRYKERRGDR
jgi:uncharacterized protein (DUF1778 family)